MTILSMIDNDDDGEHLLGREFWRETARRMGDAWQAILVGPEVSDCSLQAVWADAARVTEEASERFDGHLIDALERHAAELSVSER